MRLLRFAPSLALALLMVATGAQAVGTPKLVKNINPGPADGTPLELVSAGGLLFFSADDGSSGRELWVSDGRTRGTRRVKDINPGPAFSVPNGLTSLGRRLYFTADDGSRGRELWRSDGTRRGTKRVRDINPGPGSAFIEVGELRNLRGTLFFGADPGSTGQELWKVRL